jgi:hypothetical protein
MMRVCLAGLVLLLAGCRQSPPPAATAIAAFKVRHVPPRPKDVLEALLASSQVPLSAHATCQGVGADPDDKTIGAYLSGFLAELSNQDERNAIQTSIEAAGENGWVCRVMLRHAKGEDIWGWGVEFTIGKDGLVNTGSFRCLGAG